MRTLLQPMSANLFKRNIQSPSADVYAKIPEEKRTRDHTESEYSGRRDEVLGRPCAMAAEIATKMDLVLYKLDNIESRLNSVYCSCIYFQAHVMDFINLDLGKDFVWVAVEGIK